MIDRDKLAREAIDLNKQYVLKADEIFGKGRIELITTFDFLKEFEEYQEQMYEKYVNEKK